MLPRQPLPAGPKLWLLDLGTLDIDASYVLSGANVPLPGSSPETHESRSCLMIASLLYHPKVGLILFDAGASAIKATGAGEITDVKAVVMSHLHLDHAGGLEHFFGTDVEIWCHETELKNAFWASATGIGSGLFRPDYLRADLLHWRTMAEDVVELWPGVVLHRCPGHTEGLLVTELTLPVSGTVVLTGNLFHVKENYKEAKPQGFLMRDYNTWHRGRDYVCRLVQQSQGKVCLGHEKSYFDRFPKSLSFLE